MLFAGAADRGPADFCEVELLFDNEDGAGRVAYSELSIARRLHRGGEGQYLVNRTPVRRLDLVELLADVGLGGGHALDHRRRARSRRSSPRSPRSAAR